MCNWMCNVTSYSCMSLVGRAWVFVTFYIFSSQLLFVAVCMSLGVTHCLSFDLLCDPVNMCDSCLLLCVLPFGQGLETNSLKFLSSLCSKQNSLWFIIQPLMWSSNYALLVLHLFDASTGLISLIHLYGVAVWISFYVVPLSHIVYTSSHLHH